MNTLDKVYDLTIDIKNIDVKYNSYAKFFDDDRETSVIKIKLLNDKTPMNLENCIVEAYFILADNTYHNEACKIINSSEGVVELQLCQKCLVKGENIVRLSILKDNEISNTPVITYEVRKGLYSDDPSFNDDPLTPILSQMLLDIKVTKVNQIELQERYEKSLPKIEGKIKEVESLINRVDTAIASGTQDLEVKDARVGENGKSYAKLGDRLDEVDSQLEHIENNNFFITFKKNSNSLNDSDGLNNIIKKAKNENLKILLEKGKTYHVKNIEILEGSFIDGNGATLKLLDCADRDIYDKLIKIKGNNCTIQNLTLDGNIDNVEGDIYTGCDLIINETGNILKNLNFKNITFQNSHYVGLNISNVDNCIVDSCRFNNIDACIISNGEHCYNLIISNCIFDGHKHSEPITIMGKTENRFININSNIIKNHTNGIAINIGREPQYDELNRSYTFDVDVSNNIIDGCNCGIQINNVERYTINSNTINSVLDGVRLMRKTKNGNITNNVISKTNRSPIVFNNSNGDVTITNNILAETNNSNMHHDYGFIYFESKSNTSIIFDYNVLTEGENASSIKLNNNLNSDNVVYMRNNTLTNNLSYEYQVYFDSVKLIANNNDLFAYYGNVKTKDKVNAGSLFIDNQNLSSSTLDIYNQQCYDSVFITVTNSTKPKISHIPPQYSGKSIKIIFKNDNKISYGITSSSTVKLKKTYDTINLSCLILELVCLSGIWYEVSANEIP